MIDTSIESMGGGRPKASTDTDQRVMTKGTRPLPPWPTRGDYSPDRKSLPLTKPSTLSMGTRPEPKTLVGRSWFPNYSSLTDFESRPEVAELAVHAAIAS
jgi:hypothetical protein